MVLEVLEFQYFISITSFVLHVSNSYFIKRNRKLQEIGFWHNFWAYISKNTLISRLNFAKNRLFMTWGWPRRPGKKQAVLSIMAFPKNLSLPVRRTHCFFNETWSFSEKMPGAFGMAFTQCLILQRIIKLQISHVVFKDSCGKYYQEKILRRSQFPRDIEKSLFICQTKPISWKE